MNKKVQTVETYIKSAPTEVQAILEKIHKLIKQIAPAATEGINYGIPGYKLNNKPFIYFAFYKEHIGLYATPNTHKKFSKQLATYKQGKGSVQFPLSEKIPYKLIKEMIVFKAKELEAFKKQDSIFASLSAPAQRALANNNIKSIKQLSKFSEEELLELHGLGKSSIPKLQKLLNANKLKLKK